MSERHDTEDTFDDFQKGDKGADLKEGTHIDRYQILGLCGKGGMGAVYKAYDPELDRSIAIKILTVLPQEGETASRPQARLMREAQALAKLSHPNVVAVHDVGTFEEGVYIAMEYVKGKTIREWIKEEQPAQKEILGVLIDAGRGIQAAHTEGIIHRDFKPDNVIVGDKGQVKVLDFGLARAAGITEKVVPQEKPTQKRETTSGEKLLSTPLTRFGAMVGTIVYMAPENYNFERLDEKTDQFSFCVTLFEALYRKRPFSGKTADELAKNITRGRIEIPQEATVPKWIKNILMKGLSITKEDRYPSMTQLLDALQDDPELTKKTRRKKIAMICVILFLASMTVVFGYYAIFKGTEICTGADKKVARIWNSQKREKVRQAFDKTKLAYANDTFVRLTKRLDDYLKNWANAYTETCKATRVRGEQSEGVLDLKMGCLDKHLMKLAALARVFADADKTVVTKSVRAASSLSDLSGCDDVDSLRSRIKPPKDGHAKAKVQALRAKLADVEAYNKTGKYREGLELATEVQKEAQFVDYRLILAEAMYRLGELYKSSGEYTEAEKTLYDTVRLAGESKDALLAAKAMTLLVWVVGFQQARHQEGLSLSRVTEGVLGLSGGNDTLRSLLLNNLGAVFWRKAEFKKALEHFLKSLEIREKLHGPVHPDVAFSLNNLGIMYQYQGEYEKAQEYYRRALSIHIDIMGPDHPEVATTLMNMGMVLTKKGSYHKALDCFRRALVIREKSLGPTHPEVATILYNLADLLVSQNEFDEAQEYSLRALSIWEKALGPDHPDVTYSLLGVARVYLGQGRLKLAIEYFERLVRLCEKKTCQPDPQGRGLFTLARTLVALDRNNKRAIQLGEKAREVYGKNPKYFSKEIQDVTAWLKKHDNKGKSEMPFRARIAKPKKD